MRRREFFALLGSAAAALPLAARAEQARVWHIGILETISAALNAVNLDALRQGLREHGYVEGQNLVMEYRSADGRSERFSELVQELLRLKVDLIVTRGTPAALAAKNATKTVPLVMVGLGDAQLIVPSLARPGGNTTGLSSFVSDLEAKRIEVLHELVPRVSIVAGLYDMSNPVAPPQWNAFRAAAQILGMQPHLLDVRERNDIGAAFDLAMNKHVEALAVGIDALTQENRKLVVELAAKNRLPTIYASTEFIDAGGLISYGASYPDLYRRAATYIDKIFKGSEPGNLPIEQPVKFELIINLKAAKTIGLTVPPMLLARADEVIE